MKYEWKKHEKAIYGVKAEPVIVKIPKQKFITITGKGNPNEADFAVRIGVLNSLAWPVKMQYKKLCKEDAKHGSTHEFDEFTIFPLEGLWGSASSDPKDKDKFHYKIMMKQPDFITDKMVEEALATVKIKKPHPYLDELQFETIEDGLCIQMLHVGSYDDEPATFAIMETYMKEHNLKRSALEHREIYLNDARKTAPAKLHTILRIQVTD